VGARAGFERALSELEAARDVHVDRQLLAAEGPYDDHLPVYLPWLFASESMLARNLALLVRDGEAPPLADARALEAAEEAAELELHTSQRAAVLRLLSAPVGLLTGGPGVGKTTIVQLLASLAERAGATVLLASPTGRAAKRLAEATGRPASTVHRLLKYQPGDEGFQHDHENPLDAGLVIVDEISMLDVALAHHLVKAIRPPTRLLLVGDPDQLPSVGAGSVLADLIASERVPLARLTHIFRQSQSSLIVTNAHHVLNGEPIELPDKGVRDADFYLFPEDEPARCAELLVEVVTERIPRNFGFDWTKDVQVLAPMYRGACGVEVLNEKLREAQGVGGREVQHGARIWRVGDRVIHTRNDYEKDVFNGDMGRIASVSADGIVTVRYPEQAVTYVRGELSDLSPAFAITVHRSQGGEFPVVVMPLVTQHWMMLQRNLLYTAITRARQLVVLVGSRRALSMAIANADQSARESLLEERLVAARGTGSAG
jgi:exodeoxyribonuclease V alpha subunit